MNTIIDVLNIDSLNFYEKVKLIEQNERTVFNNSYTSEQKLYIRWFQFWSGRVDTSGGFTAYPELVMNYIDNPLSRNRPSSITNDFELLEPFENQMYGTTSGYNPIRHLVLYGTYSKTQSENQSERFREYKCPTSSVLNH